MHAVSVHQNLSNWVWLCSTQDADVLRARQISDRHRNAAKFLLRMAASNTITRTGTVQYGCCLMICMSASTTPAAKFLHIKAPDCTKLWGLLPMHHVAIDTPNIRYMFSATDLESMVMNVVAHDVHDAQGQPLVHFE